MGLSIRWKLLLSISIPLLVTYAAMLVSDYSIGRSAAISEMQAQVVSRAQTSANGINNRLEAVANTSDALAASFARSGELGDLRSRFQLNVARPNPFASAVRIIYEAQNGGARIITQRRGPGANRASEQPLTAEPHESELFAQLKNDLKSRWTAVHDETGSAQPIGTYAVPIVQNGACRGAVLIDVAVGDLMRNFRTGRRPSGRFVEPTTRPEDPAARGEFRPETFISSTTRPVATSEPSSEESPEFYSEFRGRFGDRRRGGTQPTTAEAFTFIRPPEPPDDRGGPGGPGGPPGAEPTTTTALDAEPNDIELVDRDGLPIGLRNTTHGNVRRSILQWADEHQLTDFTRAFHAALDGESGIARVPGLADMAEGFKAGETYWIALAPIKETGWVYVAAVPESQVIGPLMHRLQQRALFLAAGLVAILIVATIVAFRLSRPIERMAGAVRQLAAGNLDTRVTGVKSRDELGQLARAFNTMIGQLKAHVKALTEQTAVREKAESELRIARQIQTDLLPRTFPPFPDRPEFDLHAINVPAAGVAGDFYDFFFTADDWLTICIADVSGKGVPAALLMAVTRTIVRNLALAGLPLETIVERANEMLLADTNNNMFVTMFLAQYHPTTGRLRYVNAGHPRPFVFTRGGEVRAFGEVTAPLMGVCHACEIGPIGSAETLLEVGQTLLLYTDGVTEARGTGGSMLRDQGAVQLIHEHDSKEVAMFCESLVTAVERYQNLQPADDITIVALRRKS